MNDINMFVTKRTNKLEEVQFDKILNRIKRIGQDININYPSLVIKIIEQLYNKITTSKIDELSAVRCASMSTLHTNYNILASRLIISNHHKNTLNSFFSTMKILYDHKNVNNVASPLISDKLWDITNKYKDDIEQIIDYSYDYFIDYFGFKTLENAYLLKINSVIIERPQHMWMRVSIGIHGDNIDAIKETYLLMSHKYFTHATPTLFNAGTQKPQLSSCFLLAMEDDSIDGIYSTLKDCALISKYSGGIGLHIHNIRSKKSYIKGTNGITEGIVPMLKVFNSTARYVNQSGKRNGSFAIYLEPWHADVFDFLDLRKNQGDEETKARDLFYALWIPDLFMERVKQPDGKWSLMCPNECPKLSDVYGDEFNALYTKYEQEGKVKRTINARELWLKILDSQMETGTPYILFKDAVNRKSNQKQLGTIKSSNLCCEITQYSDANETAVCNLASIGLPAFVNKTTKVFDYVKLHETVKVTTNNLNKIIDINFYPTPKTRVSNLLHRPIGIGVQGLADTFALMDIPFHSEHALIINKMIFETIYHAALEKSNELSIERYNLLVDLISNNNNEQIELIFTEDELKVIHSNSEKNAGGYIHGAYSSFDGSPASKGILQFDMWNVVPGERYNWLILKKSIIKYGLRNSLLVAPMPTASTSQILGYNECFEPFTSNIYSRKTLAGEFIVPNKYLMNELIELQMWSEDVKNNIILNKGSIQHIKTIPEHIRNKYKTVWEIPMKHLIDMSVDRGAFICQSQSLNLWLEDPSYNKLTSMLFYAWEKGLKTGMYYLRRKARHQAQQFTIEPTKATTTTNDVDDVCEMCSA